MFMEFIIKNKRAEKRIEFPCGEDEYQSICKDLELTDNRVFIKSVIWMKDFSFLEGKTVDFDEVNYLGKRINGFDSYENRRFFAAIETREYLTVQDMINLTFNLDCYTLVKDISNLKNIGYNRVLSSKGCISTDELEKMDLEKIGRELLSSGKGIPTKYGLLFRNEDVAFETLYKGKGFPAYYYTGGEVLGVEIENGGERDYIYFPCEETEIDRALQRIGASNISECNKSIDFCGGNTEWENYFNDLLQKNDIESVNAISSAINRLDPNSDAISENLYKLSSVIEFAGVTFDDTAKVIRLARCLEEFCYYREIKDDEMLGRTLKEQEYCDIPDSMDKYMDYERYARDFLEEKGGAYTKNGDVVYLREDQSLSEILGENDIKMGGI